ncbi:hypothetical protein GE061_013723 [Apolygus lucorum]|uniref:BHLH domain-containing protein n=1 Tax=Apolygus lucorum TaxID=248454 RepID=A0A8S9XRC3_APOLU|nr:hypothetical protein GE061_013723 [Apolygus lucorum]
MASLREDKLRMDDMQTSYDEDIGSYCSLGGGADRSDSPPVPGGGVRIHGGPGGAGMEQEKRIRREIANSNERRRMQSINAGFQSLRTLLPHHEGEKLSKVKELR